ncbi:Asp-tRNA(Asn)/Glu-tRNA(Gln) amidotransferase subunit GatA [Candidatus Microgenomates bacterium]|nr:Asp-tRNA(Asn)/Glu-tRNA(Gln) amidotransferase subunit GatA [Candidatus Microgenomates bacterium]
MKLNQLTIKEAQKGLKEKKFSSQELVKACLKRIRKVDSKIKAFITVCEKEALKQAGKADKLINHQSSIINHQSLLGIPVAIKDNFCTKDVKTTASSRVLENYIPVFDATVVKRLKEAGAIIIGKTNMDAWAHGSSTEASDFYTTYNPWDLNRLPGGSSGGSAAAIIADQAIFAIGSETAGSIRQPASWCGVVGFKPTYGRVSRYGVIAMASSTDSPGPITKTVEDSALVLQVLAGKDELDATTSYEKVPNYPRDMKKRVGSLRIGVSEEYFVSGMEKEVSQKVKEAIKVLARLGAKIAKISLLDPKYSVAVYTVLQCSEVSSNLARYDGIRYGKDRTKFGEEAKRRIMLGTYTLSAGYYEAYYKKAQQARTLICKDFDKAFKKVDLIIGPTSPSTALSVGASKESAMFGELSDILLEPSSIAGLPGLNIPCGFSKGRLPIGMQIIGPKFSEDLLFRVGYAYEQATEWHKRKPKLA